MTNTEKLIRAGWTKVRATDECGQAIVSRGKLNGLACIKRANWKRGNVELCTQHAILEPAAPVEPGVLCVGAKVEQLRGGGGDPGAIGTVTAIIEPRSFFNDGSSSDGQIRVTFPGIRYPNMIFRPSAVGSMIKVL